MDKNQYTNIARCWLNKEEEKKNQQENRVFYRTAPV